jgi:hypothetical protein
MTGDGAGIRSGVRFRTNPLRDRVAIGQHCPETRCIPATSVQRLPAGRADRRSRLHRDMIRRLAAILVCCWCASACGQSTPSEAPAGTESTAADTPNPTVPGPVFRQDSDGRWIAVPETGNPSGSANETAAVPAYIAQLQLEGEVVGEFADMTAKVRVEVTRDDGWYEVPLALDQAFISDSTYSGDGKSAPVVADTAGGGLRWLFEGVGTHRLEIKFRVPIRGTAAGRQLQLSLPQLPPNYITRAVLRIPEQHVVPAEGATGVTLRKRTLESGGTELECDVEGSRWELAWRTETDDVPRISAVVTSMRVRRDGGVLRLTATQGFVLEHGGLSEILVRRPTAFNLESVERIGAPGDSLTAVPDLERAGWSRVRLGEEVQGNFELEWQFQCDFPPPQNVVIVDGLTIEGARRQRGRIEIESIPGFAARYRADQSVALRRADAAERRADELPFDFSFDFQRQPFLLAYDLAAVEAQTDADTEVFLSIAPGRSDLWLSIDLEVWSGQVHELVIDWPDYAASGWYADFARARIDVDSGGAASEFVDATLDQDALAADPHQLRLQLSRPCSGSLRGLLHFARVASAPSGTMDLVLPRPVATRQTPHALTIASAVNLETTVALPTGEPPRVPRAGDLPGEFSKQFTADDIRAYQLPADPPPITISWSEQPRSITAETTISVERLTASALSVVQTIDYDVKYRYVSALTLEAAGNPAPAAPVAAGLQVQADGQNLETEVRDNLRRIKFKEPRRGRFSVSVEQVVSTEPNASGQDGLITIPILQSVDAPYKSTMIRFPDAGPLRLADAEAGWQSWLTRSGDSGWLTTASRREVQLIADDTSQNLQQQFTVETAFVQTWFGDPGQTTVYAEYALRDAPSRVVLALPIEATATEFRWEQGDPLAANRVHTGADVPGRYVVIELSEQDDRTLSGRLTVRFRVPRSAKPGLISAYAAQFPQFGEKVVVEASYWEIVLPSGEQLYSLPSGLVPQYAWERETVMWARRLTPEYRARRESMVSDAGDLAARGNVYAYSTISALPQGEFGAMAQSLIVLIGAGFSLLLGFVFRRIPATRNLMSILVLAFLFALGGLWQLELMQLLLQPAVLGLVLAAIAVAFDVARHDRAEFQGRPLENLQPISERHSSTPTLGSSLPARTAVYHPEMGDSGRSA